MAWYSSTLAFALRAEDAERISDSNALQGAWTKDASFVHTASRNDMWSGFWPKAPSSPFTDRLNAATKYIATHRPESLAWGPYAGVGPDFVEGIRRIKSRDGQNLVLTGSFTLTSTLLEHGLADEVLLAVNPVLLGTGKRLFAQGTPARSFELVSTHAFASGIILSAYKVAGSLKTGIGFDSAGGHVQQR